MKRTILALTLALGLNGISVARDLQMVEGAYELALNDILLPANTRDTAAFKPCESCDTVRLRVSDATRYLFGSRPQALPEFLVSVDRLRQREGAAGTAAAGVYYDLRTKQITRIVVHPSTQ
jgi:hypothetical protein